MNKKLYILNHDYSTTRLCNKLLDNKYFNKNGKIKNEYKFKLNFTELGIVNSKIPSKESDKFESILFLPENENRIAEGGLRTKGLFKKSFADKPLVSIITVVYNGEKYLEQTILSVINQSYDNVEYIIIDGCSTDSTVEIIQKYDDKIDYWVSEPDEGIYYAMNKGIKLCTGEYIGIINSDDYYKLDAIENVVKVFDSCCDFVYGSILRIHRQKEVCRIMYPFKQQDINKKKFHRIPFPHPSLFINKKVYKRLGFFDTSYKICSDYDFILKMLKNNFIGKDSGKLIAIFRDGGLSSSFFTFIDEKNILISHNAGILLAYKRFLSSVIRFSIKKMFVKIISNG